jgi:hypothetical protein
MFECQQSPMASNWSRSLHAIIKMVRDVFLLCIQINRCHQFCLPLHSFKILKQTQKQREAGHWDSDIKISRSAHDQPVSTSMAALCLCWNQRQQRWWQPMLTVEARKRMCAFLGVCLIAGWYDRRVAFVSWLQLRDSVLGEWTRRRAPLLCPLASCLANTKKKMAYVN